MLVQAKLVLLFAAVIWPYRPPWPGPPCQILLYDVDFNSHPHYVGQPPAVGTGLVPRSTITRIPFGSPIVAAAVGRLTDQPPQIPGLYAKLLLRLFSDRVGRCS